MLSVFRQRDADHGTTSIRARLLGVTDPDSAFGDLTLCGERGKGVPIRWTIRRDAHGKWEEPLPEEHSLHGRFSLISDLHDQAVEEILLVVSKVRVAAAA